MALKPTRASHTQSRLSEYHHAITAWADAVVRLIRDPGQRAEMRAWGLEKAAQYSWIDVSARVLEVYRRVAR